MKSLRDGYVRYKRYNDLIKLVRLSSNAHVSNEMEIKLKLKYARICGKSVVRNGLDHYRDSDDSDGEDLEVYIDFTDDFTVINAETTAVV